MDRSQAKVCFKSLTVKIQVRKVAGSLFHGNVSDGHHLSMHSTLRDEGGRCTNVQGTRDLWDLQDQDLKRGPGEQCSLLRAAGLLSSDGPGNVLDPFTFLLAN